MIRSVLTTILAGTLAASACAANAAPDPISPRVAREMVDQTLKLVESKGVYPRKREEYAQAKAELQAALEEQGGPVDGNALRARIGKLLATLDADGHSFVIPRSSPVAAMPPVSVSPAPPAMPRHTMPPMFALVASPHGTVLRWTPPAIMYSDDAARVAYVKRFADAAAALPGIRQACALVVDLSEQTGGNAIPPAIAMYPLFGAANGARKVDREGGRAPFVDRAQLEAVYASWTGQRANPLARFAGAPVAVVTGADTSSAGEMLLVALLGESRVRTFGRTTDGRSTMNNTYPLADGSQLVLTEFRYALGDAPVFRGGIAPMHPIAGSDGHDAAVTQAADWAATNSAACKAR